jgi:hypothetical protein
VRGNLTQGTDAPAFARRAVAAAALRARYQETLGKCPQGGWLRHGDRTRWDSAPPGGVRRGFIYAMPGAAESRPGQGSAVLDFVVGLDYQDPLFDPHARSTAFKQHPFVSALLEAGRWCATAPRRCRKAVEHHSAHVTCDGG